MRGFVRLTFALGCWLAMVPAAGAGALAGSAGQSYLYPPEVRARPVVVVPDPTLQRYYWDPRYYDFCGAFYGSRAPRRWRCLREGSSR